MAARLTNPMTQRTPTASRPLLARHRQVFLAWRLASVLRFFSLSVQTCGSGRTRTAERDRLIVSVMSDIVEAELRAVERPSGTYRARGRQDAS